MNGLVTIEPDSPDPKITDFVLMMVARNLLVQGYDEKQVSVFVKEHTERIKHLGGRALAARALNEMGLVDFHLTEHGLN